MGQLEIDKTYNEDKICAKKNLISTEANYRVRQVFS